MWVAGSRLRASIDLDPAPDMEHTRTECAPNLLGVGVRGLEGRTVQKKKPEPNAC